MCGIIGVVASNNCTIEEQNLFQITDKKSLKILIVEILEKNSAQVDLYRSGKIQLISFFVGEVMKATQNRANPSEVNRILKSELDGFK